MHDGTAQRNSVNKDFCLLKENKNLVREKLFVTKMPQNLGIYNFDINNFFHNTNRNGRFDSFFIMTSEAAGQDVKYVVLNKEFAY